MVFLFFSCSFQVLVLSSTSRHSVLAVPAEKGSGRSGNFVLDGESFPLVLQDLPTIVESYKTYDDINLVKTADIGQVHHQHACVCTLPV